MPKGWLFELRTWKWWIIALLVRGAYFWVFMEEHGFHHSLYGWGAEGGDTGSYFEPIDALLAGKGYTPDLRMPGYGAVYLLFRLVTTEPGAGVLLIFSQLLLGALSCVALMRLAGLMGLDRSWQRLVFWVYAICPWSGLLDMLMLTESFCTSALILAAFHWFSHVRSASSLSLLASGLWITWVVFMRPIYAVLVPVFLLGLLLMHKPRPWRNAFLFVLPLLIADGLWTTRNWVVHRELRPLANAVYYPGTLQSPIYGLFQYLQAYGGNQACWDPRADIRWFNMREGPEGRAGRLKDINVEPPAIAFSERCTRDSLLLLAADMAEWIDTLSADEDRPTIARRANARSERLVGYFKEDRPFVYHVWSRIRLLGLELGRSGMDGPFEQHFRGDPPFAPLITALNDVWYWIVMPLGLAFAILTVVRWRRSMSMHRMLVVLVLVAVLVYPFAMRMCEGRYIVPAYPFLLLGAVLLIRAITAARSARRAA